jgi:DNA polymerase (family 10)
LPDGSLDIKDEILEKLDFVGASVHSHFNLDRNKQTKRIIKAIENPNVDCIFHLTTRVINRRKEIDIDLDTIFKLAAKTKTLLEINAYPDRLDIKDVYILEAKKKWSKVCYRFRCSLKNAFLNF